MAKKVIAFIDYIEYMIDAVHSAKEMGYETLIVFEKTRELGKEKELFDYICLVKDYSIDSISECVNKIVCKEKISAVVTFSEIGVIACAELINYYGLKGNGVEVALATRNKLIMKNKLKENNVPIAEGFTVEKVPFNGMDKLKYPCIIKPVVGSRSFGVRLVESETDLISVFNILKRSNQFSLFTKYSNDSMEKNGLIIEEYLPGPEVTCDVLFINNSPLLITICDKPYNPEGPTFEEQCYITPSVFSEDVQNKIMDVTVRAARALGISHGPVHAEIRITPNGPYIIEIASRMGGCIGQLVKDSMDTSYYNMILDCYLNNSVDKYNLKPKRFAAYGCAHIDVNGEITEIAGIEEAKDFKNITKFKVKKKVGDNVFKFPRNLGGVVAVYATGDTIEKVRTTIMNSISKLKVITKGFDGKEETIPLEIQWFEDYDKLQYLES